jgi:methyl-accepting chemotaxis protein
VILGAIIFTVTSLFVGAFLLYPEKFVNVWTVFVFFTIESALVFILTTLFLKNYYDRIIAAIKRAVNRDFKFESDVYSDTGFLGVLDIIKETQKKEDEKVVIDRKQLEAFRDSVKKASGFMEQDTERFNRIQEEMRTLKRYIESVEKIFEKIKTIGLEIKTASKHIDESTQNVMRDAKQQTEMASKGVKAIGREIQGVNDLKHSILSSTQIIEELMQMSDRIKIFVVKIADMAKKTNLLALNAGIEAARAGEAGKSFSVVASEIKNLSGNSNQSAEEIAAILKNIQMKTKEVIEIIKMTEKIEENIQTFYKTGDIFIEIVKAVKHIEKIIISISSYTDEHFTDSELLFKIITDNGSKVTDYTKLVERMSGEAEEFSKVSMGAQRGLDHIGDVLDGFIELYDKRGMK